MRASTIFAVIIAILLALGVAVAVKASGFLGGPKEAKKEPPPPMILVAATNLFQDTYLDPKDVKLRAARSKEELDQLRAGELLPPTVQAVSKRMAKVNIPADAPIRKDYLEDMGPINLAARLQPCERAVNCCIHKQYCAGGLLQVGDVVDLQLITSVEGDGIGTATTDNSRINTVANRNEGVPTAVGTHNASAVLVRNARVIARRNSLFPVNTPLGPDCCVNYTLAVNPYRAGLVEFVKDKGIIALLPISEMERRQWENARLGLTRPNDGTVPASLDRGNVDVRTNGNTSERNDRLAQDKQFIDQGFDPILGNCRFSIPGNPEYKDEDQRVAAYVAGLYTIGEHDLARIFGLSYIPAKVNSGPTRVESISGVQLKGEHIFDRPGQSGIFAQVGTADTLTVNANSRNRPTMAIRNTTFTPNGMVATSTSTPFRFRPPDANCYPNQNQPVQQVTVSRRH